MKRVEIEKGTPIDAYLSWVFQYCNRPRVNWRFATLYSDSPREWPVSLEQFEHGDGLSPYASSKLLASELLEKFSNVSIRVDEPLAKPTDPWILSYDGPGEVRLDEPIVGVVHRNIHSADDLSEILARSISLPAGLLHVFTSRHSAHSATASTADADLIVVTGVFDGEAFILLSQI